MSEPVVYLNDGFVPASQAHINIYDLGIVLGATLTEMTRTFKHEPFRLEEHVRRLLRSCKYAGIELALDHEGLVKCTRDLIETNSKLIGPEQDLGVVHFVTPGENQIYAGSAGKSVRLTPTLCIHSFPLPFAVWRPYFEQGVHAVTPSIRHVPPQCVDPKTKNRSRLHYWLADKQSQAVDPAATSLLLDLDGNLTECSGANFVVGRERRDLYAHQSQYPRRGEFGDAARIGTRARARLGREEFAALRRGQCRRGLVDQHALLSSAVYAHQQYAHWRRKARPFVPPGDGGVEPAGGDGHSGAA